MTINLDHVRAQFPALQSGEIYFDNPAGTQVPQIVIDRMTHYLTRTNSNRGAASRTGRESDAVLDELRDTSADFLNAARSEEISFGQNMTTLTFALSRALAGRFGQGDTIAVTRLDHDANISPWIRMASDQGAEIEWIDFDVEDGTLRMDSVEAVLAKRPRLLALGYASNALGTINPARQITQMAKEAGALVFVDAVQYAPHGVTDVQDLDCDFLACSAYKFFGTHIGMMYTRYDLSEQLPAYRLRPAPSASPGKWETGTQNHEGLAGTLGAFEYIQSLGDGNGSRRERLVSGIQAMQAYEHTLSAKAIEVFNSVPGLTLYGLSDPDRISDRVPTFSFTLAGHSPNAVAEYLAAQDIFVYYGNYYALSVTERLGVEDTGGMVRVGPVHYNTVEELEKLGEVLREM
jgi:cysteine desulfurase family protein (TIGR01976 family)